MRFFILLVVALAVTVTWQTTIGAAPYAVDAVGTDSAARPSVSSTADAAATVSG